MGLPTSYLTSAKNLPDILAAMQTAQAPKKFTHTFLEGLGFKSSSDRLIIGVLKALGLLSEGGEPTQRYFEFLDQSQSERVLAEAVREAYADLFQVNTKAHDLSSVDIRNKLKTLTQGQYSDAVLDKMASTFKALSSQADFTTPPRLPASNQQDSSRADEDVPPRPAETSHQPTGQLPPAPMGLAPVGLPSLVYNIQLHLPESRDQAVYDVLFRSLRDHLLR